MPGKASKPNETDFRIGKIIQILRAQQGLTQKDLARMLNVTFQQVQKYEVGHNRISASRLYDIAHIFKVPIGALYNESDNEPAHSMQMLDLIHSIYKLSAKDLELLTTIVARLGK